MMARKLSRFARQGNFLLATVAVSMGAARASAQDNVRVEAPTTVVANPFTKGAVATVAVPEELEAPRTVPTTFNNPFARMSLAPSVAPPLRPGPISRWQRRNVLADDLTPVKTAILSTNPLAGQEAAWDQLPPAESLRDSLVNQAAPGDAPSGPHFGQPPDPIHFSPKSLAQPAWLTQDADAARRLPPAGQAAALDAVSINTFEVPADATAIGTHAPQEPLNPVESILGPSEQAPDASPPDNDWLPVVVTDHADSPENCYAQAQKLAEVATSQEQMANVIEVCQRGLAGGAAAELALALRRLAAWSHNRRGELHSEGHDQAGALAEFQKAISLDPNCWAAIHNRGVTYAQQSQLPAALRDFNRVLELNPGLAIASRNRAELLAAVGRMDEAVRDYTAALEQIPDDARLYQSRGYAWQRLGEYEQALADFDQSLILSPDDPDAHTQRGNLAAEVGDFDQALRSYQQALAIDANWGEALRSLAWLWATCPDATYRDAERALAAAEQAVQLAPQGDSFALDALAAAHANAGHFKEAAQIQQQAIAAATPDFRPPLEQRLALYRQGQPYRGEHAFAVQAASHTMPTAGRVPATR